MANARQDNFPFLNGSLEETIYMVQPEGFIAKGQENKVCKLQKSIYGLKQASRSWNIKFDQSVKSFGFIQCPDELVYTRDVVKTWWYFWYFMWMISSSLETMWEYYLQLKYGYQNNSI